MKASTWIIGLIGTIGAWMLYRITHPSGTVMYGDEFGGAPPIDSSYYFPRKGYDEPLAEFPATRGIPYSPVGSMPMPSFETSTADEESLPIQDLTPQTESNVATNCTKTCDDCAQTATGGPFQGGPFSNPIKRLRERSY